MTDDIAETCGVKENTGALVAGVTADSPAAKAGIKRGDVILKFDGKDVTTMRGLPRLVAQTPIGKEVDVEVLRKGQKRSFKRGRRPACRGGRADKAGKDASEAARSDQEQGARDRQAAPTGQALIGMRPRAR